MLKFKNKVEQITCTNEVGDYKVDYRFQLKEGVLNGGIDATATTEEGRHVKNMNTSDGENFYGNTNENVEDDLTGLHNQIKNDLIELFSNTSEYISNE